MNKQAALDVLDATVIAKCKRQSSLITTIVHAQSVTRALYSISISVQNKARARNARAALRMQIEVGHSVSKVAADLDTPSLCRTEFDHCLRRIQGISKSIHVRK
jgi:hypothetical protein